MNQEDDIENCDDSIECWDDVIELWHDDIKNMGNLLHTPQFIGFLLLLAIVFIIKG
jgi:hypothetical protein